MYLDKPGTFAAAGMNHVIAPLILTIKKHGAFLKTRCDLLFSEVADGQIRCCRHWIAAETFRSVCAGDRELLVLRRAHRSAHAYSADNLPVENHRNSSLERRKERIGQRGHRRAA